MNCVKNQQGESAVEVRRGYAQPVLTILGDVRSLTETGSALGSEDSDGMHDDMCNGNVNAQFNMC